MVLRDRGSRTFSSKPRGQVAGIVGGMAKGRAGEDAAEGNGNQSITLSGLRDYLVYERGIELQGAFRQVGYLPSNRPQVDFSLESA